MKKKHNSYNLKYQHSNHVLRFGNFGIKSLSFYRLTEEQLILLCRHLIKISKNYSCNKRPIKIWNFLFLNLLLTKLNSESRMGKGKGSIYAKAIFLKPGCIFIEFESTSLAQAKALTYQIKKRLGLKLALIIK
uniref:ribosomal protein L16 n=1 Tax=Cystoclonium purpureum f. stellatum TaxID=3024809 RepID=UPI0023EF923C|nr:ribosomal protein L16 [Cystoclonium purpureum f. stellatum]WDY85176.1 ribosomal protein L16 [Cystoclonium purpureum f. stellatum]